MLGKFWVGSDDAYDHAVAALEKIDSFSLSKISAGAGCQINGFDSQVKDSETSPFLSVVDGIGIVNIQGSLLDGNFGDLGIMFGITGYGDIQKALMDAVANPEVKSILLMVNSGGGSVSGVSETARLIQTVDKIKPVVTYTNSTMASAALWLGLSARNSYVSDTAIVGSIGTVTVLESRYRQLQAEGVDLAVVRSGKYKAIGGSVEPITELALAETQKTIDYLANIFLTYVAERRGVSKISADSKFGQGRTFVGQQAVDASLVDGILTYNQVFTNTKSLNPSDKSIKFFGATIASVDNSVDNSTMQKEKDMHIPTPEQLAAMAAGINISAELAETSAGTAGEQEGAKDADSDETQDQLAEELASVSAELAQVKSDLAQAQALASEMQARLAEDAEVLADLSSIVQAGIKTMSLPFNLDTGPLAEMGGKELISKHKEVSALFKSKIKAGTSSVTAKETKSQESTIAPVFAEHALSLPGAN